VLLPQRGQTADSGPRTTYAFAIDSLRQAGMGEESLDKLLGQPIDLPRPTLGLSVNEEIRANQAELVDQA
jgi:hypothetical protein